MAVFMAPRSVNRPTTLIYSSERMGDAPEKTAPLQSRRIPQHWWTAGESPGMKPELAETRVEKLKIEAGAGGRDGREERLEGPATAGAGPGTKGAEPSAEPQEWAPSPEIPGASRGLWEWWKKEERRKPVDRPRTGGMRPCPPTADPGKEKNRSNSDDWRRLQTNLFGPATVDSKTEIRSCWGTTRNEGAGAGKTKHPPGRCWSPG